MEKPKFSFKDVSSERKSQPVVENHAPRPDVECTQRLMGIFSILKLQCKIEQHALFVSRLAVLKYSTLHSDEYMEPFA